MEQYLLQEAEVDNTREEEFPAIITTLTPCERWQDFFCWKINKSTSDKQTKNNGDVSSEMASPAVCENTAPIDNFVSFAHSTRWTKSAQNSFTCFYASN